MTLDQLRTHFPHTRETRYLNHAATGPLSRPVMEAVGAYLAERHRSKIENYFDFQPVIDEARRRLGRLVGASADRVEFMQNTSTALDVLARGIDWQPGDRIAVPDCEFPANVYPFMNLARQGVTVDFIASEGGTLSLDAIERALTPRTRLLSVSWVQFLSGFRLDLEAVGRLCRAHEVLFCVDAIQGLGALRLDAPAAGIDFLACGGQKWLMATQGSGFLYVTERLQEQMTPAAGWLHGPVDWDNFCDYRLAFHEDASRFRLGTLNHVGVAALHAALGLYFEAGPAWCEQQVLARAATLADGLRQLGLHRYGTDDPAHTSGIVTVEHPEAEALFTHLKEHQIQIALRNRKLRFAPTYYNTPDEVAAVLEAVRAFGKVRA